MACMRRAPVSRGGALLGHTLVVLSNLTVRNTVDQEYTFEVVIAGQLPSVALTE